MKETTLRQHSAPVQGVRGISVLVGVVLLFAVMVLAQAGFATAARAKAFEESEVKSVFLFNLTKFIIWPEEIEGGGKAEFAIAILGTDPFGNHLDKVITSETVKGRKIAVRRYQDREELQWQAIDLLFIGKDMVGDLPELRAAARKSGVLTVGDAGGFCQAGGMVNLLTIENRIKIEVNVEETRKSDFLVSAQMLKLAGIVTTRAEEEQ